MQAILFFHLLSCAVFAQNDGITGSASRTVKLVPTEATFKISVLADLSLSIEDVLPKLADFGLTIENVEFIGALPPDGPLESPLTLYGFSLVVPLTRVKEITAKIDQFRTTGKGLYVEGYVTGIQAAAAQIEEARRRTVPELIVEAKQRAQETARSAGVSLGRILSIAEDSPYGSTFGVTVRFAIN